MASSRLLFLLFIISISISTHHFSTLTVAQPDDFLYRFCIDSNGNYTTNSTYRSNLNRVLSSFSSLKNTQFNGGFYNFSAGGDKSSDGVSAIGLCRGDVTPDDCYSCLNDSRLKLTEQCPNQKEAIGWYDNCFLRYSNGSTVGADLETVPRVYFYNMDNVTSDVDQFDEALNSLYKNLASRAASGGSVRKFATGNVSVSNSDTIYALAQCTPDLSQKDCSSCLAMVFEDVQQCCSFRIGARSLGPSCSFRYEVERFYNITTFDTALSPAPATSPATPTPTPAPALVPAPPMSSSPSTNTTDTTGTDQSNKSPIVVVHATTVVAAVLLVIFTRVF